MSRRLDTLAYPLIAVALLSLGLSMRGTLVLAPLWVALLLHPWCHGRGIALRGTGAASLVPHLACGVATAVLASIWPVTDVGGDPQGGPFFVAYYALCLGLIKLYGAHDAQTLPRLLLCTSAAHASSAMALRRYLGRTPAWHEGPLGSSLPEPHVFYVALLAGHVVLLCLMMGRAQRLARPSGAARRAAAVGVCALVVGLTWVSVRQSSSRGY